METFPSGEKAGAWVTANLENERSEIERATKEFLQLELTDENVEPVMDILRVASMIELSENDWKRLENTDSFNNVRPGHIEDAEQLTEQYNQTLEPTNQRDFKSLLEGFTNGQAMEVPIILQNETGAIHLVSGNTRLMIARALNIRPKVILGQFR